MIGNRRRARESALQLLYQDEFHSEGGAEAEQHFWNYFAERDPSRAEFLQEIKVFAMSLVDGVRSDIEGIDNLIRSAAKNWRLERMSRVDRNILRMATCELQQMTDIPPKVTLNEAIEIAKIYGSEDSSAFINGILDKISRQLRGHSAEDDPEAGETSTQTMGDAQADAAADGENYTDSEEIPPPYEPSDDDL